MRTKKPKPSPRNRGNYYEPPFMSWSSIYQATSPVKKAYDDSLVAMGAARDANKLAMNAPKTLTADQLQFNAWLIANPRSNRKPYVENPDWQKNYTATANAAVDAQDNWINQSKRYSNDWAAFINQNQNTPMHDRIIKNPDLGSWLNDIASDDPTRYKTTATRDATGVLTGGYTKNPEYNQYTSIINNHKAVLDAANAKSLSDTWKEPDLTNAPDNVQWLGVMDANGNWSGGYIQNPNYRTASQRSTDYRTSPTKPGFTLPPTKSNIQLENDAIEANKLAIEKKIATDPSYKQNYMRTQGASYPDATKNSKEEQSRYNPKTKTYELIPLKLSSAQKTTDPPTKLEITPTPASTKKTPIINTTPIKETNARTNLNQTYIFPPIKQPTFSLTLSTTNEYYDEVEQLNGTPTKKKKKVNYGSFGMNQNPKVNKKDIVRKKSDSKKLKKTPKVYKSHADTILDEILHGTTKKPVKKFDYKNCGI